MAAPLIQQGSLNRLLAALNFVSNQGLNVISSYLAKEAIRLSFEGTAGLLINTLTGVVTSPEPYLIANITVNLLKTQALAAVFKTQFETNTSVGDIQVIPDAITLPQYYIGNCSLQLVNEQTYDGNVPGFVVMIKGVYQTNANLWAGA